MPIGRVKFVVHPVNAQALAAFQRRVENTLAAHPVLHRMLDWSIEADQTTVLDVEFTTPVAARAFQQWFKDNSGTIRPLVSGYVMTHLCSHDDPEVYSCRDDPRSQFQQVVL